MPLQFILMATLNYGANGAVFGKQLKLGRNERKGWAATMATKPIHPMSTEYPIWLRRSGDYVIVAIEIEGEFRDIIQEHYDGPISHIVECPVKVALEDEG